MPRKKRARLARGPGCLHTYIYIGQNSWRLCLFYPSFTRLCIELLMRRWEEVKKNKYEEESSKTEKGRREKKGAKNELVGKNYARR